MLNGFNWYTQVTNEIATNISTGACYKYRYYNWNNESGLSSLATFTGTFVQ
jgi:hypothetical protein